MAEHGIVGKGKLDDKEQKRHLKGEEHQPSSEMSLASDTGRLIGDTTFNPPVERHTALLSKASSEQKVIIARQLQQAYGNSYVQRLVQSMNVQAKLTVNRPGDADRVADMVAKEALPSTDDEAVERKADSQAGAIKRDAEGEEDVLRSEKNPGAGQLGRIDSELARPPVSDVLQAENDVPEAVAYPSINSITGDSKVKEARDEDWQAGKKDYLERFGWMTWDAKTKKYEVTGRRTGNEFGVSPGPAPADAPPVYAVGHYHTHPPLSEKMKKDQKEYREKTGKEMFPIGPSSADKGFATNHNSPGIVEDFITALRWPSWLTWDFKYGPTKRQ